MKSDPKSLPKVTSSDEAFDLFRSGWDDHNINLFEMFKIMLLSRNRSVLGSLIISQGGMSGTLVDPKLIFAPALIAGASGIILCHNHPSANLRPSDADVRLTRKLSSAAKLMDMSIVDHIILSNSESQYFSFADDGLL